MNRQIIFDINEKLDKYNLSVKDCELIEKFLKDTKNEQIFKEKLSKYGYSDIYDFRKGLTNNERSARGECTGFVMGFLQGICMYESLMEVTKIQQNKK